MILELTVGPPASGKTTYAEQSQSYQVDNINRDDIRQQLFGPFEKWSDYVFTDAKENQVTTEQVRRSLQAAKLGYKKVIISDTNINPKTRAKWEAIAMTNGWTVEYKLFHITEFVAQSRDIGRKMAVGKKVIRNMMLSYHQNCKELIIEHFKGLIQEHWKNNPETDVPLVLVDLDGTVAEMHKGEPGRRKPYEWTRVGEDTARPQVIKTVELWAKSGADITFFSGRDGICMPETTTWLHAEINHDWALLMRQAKDQRPDWIVKMELLLQVRKPTLMFDDRQQVVDVMRAVGVEVFQVQPGDF